MHGYPTGRLLSIAARRVEHAWEHVLREYDLSSAGLVVLHVLTAGSTTQREIARSCRVTVQTASRTVERLERLGTSADVPTPATNAANGADRPGRTEICETLLLRERTDPALTAAIGDDDPALRRLFVEADRRSTSVRFGVYPVSIA